MKTTGWISFNPARSTSAHASSSSASQRGFSLLEVMISAAVLTIGIVAVIGGLGAALTATQYAQFDLIARQKALQAMESVYTARNTQQITFAQIANIGSGGIFTVGPTPLLFAGPDGLVNTADDTPYAASGPCPAGPECVVLPGPDGILGTADDTALSLTSFTRQIQINKVLNADGSTNPNLKQIVVTVTYNKNGAAGVKTFQVQALISAFR
jgi:prepilin-type N-terminal cleavage/methylation domain-containing protein